MGGDCSFFAAAGIFDLVQIFVHFWVCRGHVIRLWTNTISAASFNFRDSGKDYVCAKMKDILDFFKNQVLFPKKSKSFHALFLDRSVSDAFLSRFFLKKIKQLRWQQSGLDLLLSMNSSSGVIGSENTVVSFGNIQSEHDLPPFSIVRT